MSRKDFAELDAELAEASEPRVIIEHPIETPGRIRHRNSQIRRQYSAMRRAFRKAKRQGCSQREILRRTIQSAASFGCGPLLPPR